ncbi:MAG: kelch repeat-containing protein [Opitutus sp.]
MITSILVTADAWEKLPDLPAPNGGFVAGETDGKVVVVGGTNWQSEQKAWLSTVHQFDPATSTWTTLDPLAEPLAYGIGGKSDGAFVVVGGTTGQHPWPGLIRIARGRVTVSNSGGLTQPAVVGAGGVINDELIAVGGADDAANVKGLGRATTALNVKTGAARTLAEYPGPGFGVAASAVISGELFLFAGVKWDAATNAIANFSEAYAFSVSQNRWRALKPYPLSARGVTAVALDDHHIYLAGGYGADAFTDRAFIYDVAADTYRPAPVLPYPGQVGLVRCGEFVYCIGGEDRMKHRSAALHRIAVTVLLKTPPAAVR